MDSNHKIQNAHPLVGGAYIQRIDKDGATVDKYQQR